MTTTRAQLRGATSFALAFAVAGCTAPPPTNGPEISCGPLDDERCDDAVDEAVAYLASRDSAAIRRIEFVDENGSYVVTFADGTRASVSP